MRHKRNDFVGKAWEKLCNPKSSFIVYQLLMHALFRGTVIYRGIENDGQ